MHGVSAEEIAHILGHSSVVVAKHYILATPALALIRAKALGSNPVWQNMVAMMLTGKLVPSKEWVRSTCSWHGWIFRRPGFRPLAFYVASQHEDNHCSFLTLCFMYSARSVHPESQSLCDPTKLLSAIPEWRDQKHVVRFE